MPSDAKALSDVRDHIVERVLAYAKQESLLGIDRLIFGIKLSLQEALINANRHGNKSDPNKHVVIEWSLEDRMLVVEIEDQGKGFDWKHIPVSTSEEGREKPSGRGVLLMRGYMDKVEYNTEGNRVRLVKVLEGKL